MAALKDDDDLCRCNQLTLVSIDSLTAGISLSDLNNKPFTGGNQSDCPNISFVENDWISLKWLGYRSKEENKAPIIGASAV